MSGHWEGQTAQAAVEAERLEFSARGEQHSAGKTGIISFLISIMRRFSN